MLLHSKCVFVILDGSHPSHSAQTSNSAAVTVPQSNNSSRVEEKPPLSEESVQKKIGERHDYCVMCAIYMCVIFPLRISTVWPHTL